MLLPRRSLVYLRSTNLLYPPSYFSLLEKMTILINGKMTSIKLKTLIMMKKMMLFTMKMMMLRWLGRCSATPQGISSSSRCQPFLVFVFVWHWCLYCYLISMLLFNLILSSQGRWSLDVENAWLSLHRFEILSRK